MDRSVSGQNEGDSKSMADLDTQIHFIKKANRETDLYVLLSTYTKTQLLELDENLAQTAKKSWKKDQIITAVMDSILEQAYTVFADMIEDILSHFPEANTQLYRLDSLDAVRAFIPLIKKGFFFVSQDEEGYVFIIPDEIAVMTEEESAPNAHLLQEWQAKQQAIYGRYSLEQLRAIWNRHFKEALTAEEVLELLD